MRISNDTCTDYPVHHATWSPNADAVLYTNGKNLIIKSLTPNSKPTQWKAHEKVVLRVDWNTSTNLILTVGEDSRYKIWDTFGRQVFSSQIQPNPLSCAVWTKSGDAFVVAGYNTVKVCSKLGVCLLHLHSISSISGHILL